MCPNSFSCGVTGSILYHQPLLSLDPVRDLCSSTDLAENGRKSSAGKGLHPGESLGKLVKKTCNG